MQIKANRIALLLSQTGDTDAERDLCKHGSGGPPQGVRKKTWGRRKAAIHFTDRETEAIHFTDRETV